MVRCEAESSSDPYRGAIYEDQSASCAVPRRMDVTLRTLPTPSLDHVQLPAR